MKSDDPAVNAFGAGPAEDRQGHGTDAAGDGEKWPVEGLFQKEEANEEPHYPHFNRQLRRLGTRFLRRHAVGNEHDHLHGAGNNVTKQTALDEKGQIVAGAGDKPNRHDILTGSRADGTAFAPRDPDMTCGNWTRNGTEGAVIVGHHDRKGPTADPWATSWNSSHQSRGGCRQEALRGTGGDGLVYCFAAN